MVAEMAILRLAVILALLTGCSTNAAFRSPEKAGYFMISTGEASLVYKALVGGVEYCKASQHNLQGVEFTGDIEFDGETCKVTVTAGSD